ncbi:putative ankyrin repeat protein RF_0580 [Harmonia axyridis]|uniref:putative ankyrin repeat protein RF_0580 n=1 Tax=Harmonia axyridis TaxID=115357 RepID=UPI001E278994|nr:putative ankyrin repeat protein RF_0580 [Harmonia axyridis]
MTKLVKTTIHDSFMYSGSTYDVTNFIKSRSNDSVFINDCLTKLVIKRTKEDFTDRDYEIIDYLLYKGADPTHCPNDGKSLSKLLDIVMDSKDERLIEIFVQYMKYLDDPTKNPCDKIPEYFSFHSNAVIAAVAYQNLDVVRYAVKLSVRPNERSFHFKNAPLHIAASLPSVDITKYILQYYPNIEVKNRSWETPLLFAARNNQIEQVRFLLKQGAYYRVNDINDNTLLHVVCYQKRKIDVEMLEVLLDAGCDPNAFGDHGLTPLHIVAMNQNKPSALEFAKLLIQRGGDVNAKAVYGDTVLHTLLEQFVYRNQFLDIFLNSKADLTITNDSRSTFLDILLLDCHTFKRQHILKHLVLLDVSGKFNIGSKPISDVAEDQQFEKDCRAELQRLNFRRIPKFQTGPWYSLMEILILDEMEISRLCINRKLRRFISKFNEKKYTHYGRQLKTILERGLKIYQEREGL